MTLENWDKPETRGWGAKWGALMAWILSQQYLRGTLKFGPGGETGPVNDMVRHTFERTGANVMGKCMFDQGEVSWPEEAPFHTPVYVLTHEKRDPWVRPAGRRSTSSMKGLSVRWRWLGRLRWVVTFAFQEAQM